MQQLVIGYLFQYGQCSLPGIGKFSLQHIPASYDVTQNIMSPPLQKVVFDESPSIIAGNFIETISLKNGITKDAARILLDHYCDGIKAKFENGTSVEFETIGSLYKSAEGKIVFISNDTTSYTTSLIALRIQHPDDAHDIMVGNDIISSDNSKGEDRRIKAPGKRTWLTVTIIVGILSILILVFHFYRTPFSSSSVGNTQKINVVDPPKTHE